MSNALVPLPPDPSELDTYADPGKFVELACERAKEWLAQALDKGDIDGIVELRSQAEAIRTYTAQKQLGKDAELSAAEIVRRAERGIGLAIRKGQKNGEVARRGERLIGPDLLQEKISPTQYLTSAKERVETYAMTDGVPDEQFEEAIEEAKEEGNLSRANVVRKVKPITADRIKKAAENNPPPSSWQRVRKAREMAADGYTSRQIGNALGIKGMTAFRARHRIEVPADAVVGKTQQIDGNRIVADIVMSLEASRMTLDLVEMDQLDPKQVEYWATSLSSSIRSLNRLHKQLKEMAHG